MKKNLTNKSNIKRKRKHGFLRRMSDSNGQATVQRRRKKGRKVLSA